MNITPASRHHHVVQALDTQINLVGMLMSYWQASYHNHFPLDQSLWLEEGNERQGFPYNSTLPSYLSKSFGIDCDS